MEEQEPQKTGNSPKPEGLLYHYTDQKGLLGILDSKSIWATHVRYLNDASEFVLAWDKSWEKLIYLVDKSEYAHKDQLRNIYRRFRKAVLDSPGRGKYYLWCLTDDKASETRPRGFEGDRLSQWRGYSGGGYGFSLGFDATTLESSFNTPVNVVLRLGRCQYDEAEQDAQIESLAAKHFKEFLDKWSTYFTHLRNPSLSPFENFRNNAEYTIEPIVNMYVDFIEFGMFMKHRGYLEENE